MSPDRVFKIGEITVKYATGTKIKKEKIRYKINSFDPVQFFTKERCRFFHGHHIGCFYKNDKPVDFRHRFNEYE